MFLWVWSGVLGDMFWMIGSEIESVDKTPMYRMVELFWKTGLCLLSQFKNHSQGIFLSPIFFSHLLQDSVWIGNEKFREKEQDFALWTKALVPCVLLGVCYDACSHWGCEYLALSLLHLWLMQCTICSEFAMTAAYCWATYWPGMTLSTWLWVWAQQPYHLLWKI
jgi:hypothetical protein